MQINWIESKRSHDILLKSWYEERYLNKEIDDINEFTWDGPLKDHWSTWLSEENKPRILFLMKEAHSGYHPELPISQLRLFHTNIARWRYVIKELYRNINQELTFKEAKYFKPSDLNDVAIVEVKKLSEDKPKSSNKEIEKYAIDDRDYLLKQLEIINPQIVLCGYTQDSYDCIDYNYDKQISETIKRCSCHKFGDRLVIDFYHPSNWSLGSKQLFDILCSIIKNGNVFKEFTWG